MSNKKRTSKKNKKQAENFPGVKILVYSALIIISGVFIYMAVSNSFIQDDAFISFRYAGNLLSGKGLVFNAGEYVEGFTNLLWILILSALSLFGIEIISAAQILSVAFGAASIVLLYFFTKRIVYAGSENLSAVRGINRFFAESLSLTPPLMLALSPAFIFWSVSAMETSLFVFVTIAALFVYLNRSVNRKNILLSILLVLSFLIRPEGVIIAAVILLHKFYFGRKEIFSAGVFKSAWFFETVVFVALVLVVTLFRLVYYGYPFPNTFYAKTGMSPVYLEQGINYFLSFAAEYLFYGTLLIPFLIAIKKEGRKENTLLVLMSTAFIVYTIVIGGDVLALYRFFLPVLPLVFILGVSSIRFITGKLNFGSNKSVLTGVIILLAGLSVFNFLKNTGEWKKYTELESQLVFKMKLKADWIKLQSVKQSKTISVAATTIGAFGYYSGANVIDMLGLTDETIAHNPAIIESISGGKDIGWKERRYNAGYILDRKPDYILFSTGIKPSAYAERALFADPRFFFYYYPQQVFLKDIRTNLIFFTKKEAVILSRQNPALLEQQINVGFIESYINATNLLQTYERTKDPTLVEKIIAECAETNKLCPPNFGDGHRLLGRIYYFAGDIPRTIEELNKAVEIDDLNCIAHAGLHGIYLMRKDKEKAEYHLNKIKRYSPYMIPN